MSAPGTRLVEVSQDWRRKHPLLAMNPNSVHTLDNDYAGIYYDSESSRRCQAGTYYNQPPTAAETERSKAQDDKNTACRKCKQPAHEWFASGWLCSNVSRRCYKMVCAMCAWKDHGLAKPNCKGCRQPMTRFLHGLTRYCVVSDSEKLPWEEVYFKPTCKTEQDFLDAFGDLLSPKEFMALHAPEVPPLWLVSTKHPWAYLEVSWQRFEDEWARTTLADRRKFMEWHAMTLWTRFKTAEETLVMWKHEEAQREQRRRQQERKKKNHSLKLIPFSTRDTLTGIEGRDLGGLKPLAMGSLSDFLADLSLKRS